MAVFIAKCNFASLQTQTKSRISHKISMLKSGIKNAYKILLGTFHTIKFYLMNKKLINRQNTLTKKRSSAELLDILLELFLELSEREKDILSAKIKNARFIQCSDRHGKIKLKYCDANNAFHTILITPS